MRNNETGRSMVEMLGVLAIIGVLSVAGIAGYSMAMRKVKVNDILAYASQCGILARAYNAGTGVGTTAKSCTDLGADTLADSGITVATGMTGETDAGNTKSTVKITIGAGNKAICDDVKSNTNATGDCTAAASTLSVEFAD